MNIPPIVNQAKPANVATVEQVADYSAVKQVNSITAGLILGLIAAAVCGPAMMMGGFGCIACGLAVGGLCGNLSRSTVDAALFLLLMLVAGAVAAGGVSRSIETQKKLESIKF